MVKSLKKKKVRGETIVVYGKLLFPLEIQISRRVSGEGGMIAIMGIFLFFPCAPLHCLICFDNKPEILLLFEKINIILTS
jgi:hypothetical protein